MEYYAQFLFISLSFSLSFALPSRRFLGLCWRTIWPSHGFSIYAKIQFYLVFITKTE